LKNEKEKERKSWILENNFHVELLRPHREKAKRKEKKIQNKKRNKKEEVKGQKRQSDKKIKAKAKAIVRSGTKPKEEEIWWPIVFAYTYTLLWSHNHIDLLVF
jgi:hypothetical protein